MIALVNKLESLLPELAQSLAKTEDSHEEFESWLKVEKNKTFGEAPDDLPDRLSNFVSMCKNASERAKSGRSRLA